MKNIFLKLTVLIILINCFSFKTYSQNEDKYVINLKTTIYTSFMQTASMKMKEILSNTSIQIISQSESTTKLYYEFYINEEGFKQMDSLLPKIGYISEKNITTTNNNDRISKINLEIEYLQKKKEAYDKEIQSMTEKNDRYFNYWNEIRTIEKDIFDLKTELSSFEKDKKYAVTLSIYDEMHDYTDTKVSWVNMPGVAFDFLVIESPKSSISAKQYMGYGIKYLFTRGKSYANIGALKEYSSEIPDTTRFKELFYIGFGQDYYSKHFGRGKNKWMNLYTGYNVGGFFATGDTKKKSIIYLTPYLGVELFKNQYILIDNRVGYFVPFAENRNLRGISYSFSFNFVF